MKLLLLLLISSLAYGQGTFSVVAGMNVCVKLPASYNTANKYATIVFMPGAGEIGTNKDLLVKYGPNAYAKMGWDGSATVDGVKTEFIIVSIQPVLQYPYPSQLKPAIDYILTNYKVDEERFYGTGLSRGAFNINNYALYLPTANNFTYQKTFKAIVNYVGQQPDDTRYTGVALPYPNGFKSYAANGGKYLGIAQKQDGRGIDMITKAMNIQVLGSAVWVETNFGNGGHCCWDNVYGGNGIQPAKVYNGMNIYEWLASLKKPVVIMPTPTISVPDTLNFKIQELINYRIGVNDAKTITATGLPKGLSITNDGLISGITDEAGIFAVKITASNEQFSTEKRMVIVVKQDVKWTITLYTDGTYKIQE